MKNLLLVRKPLSLMLLVMFAFLVSFKMAAPEDGKPEWSTFSHSDGNFKILFPAKPDFSSEKTESGITRYKATATYGSEVYAVHFADLGVDVTNPEELIDVSLEAFANELDAEIEEQKETKVASNPATEASMYSKSKDLYVNYKIFFMGNVQYQLVAAQKDAYCDSKVVGKFFKSFKTLN